MLLKEIEALSMLPATESRDREIAQLRRRVDSMRAEIYAHLSPWQRVQLARHPNRPCMLDYVHRLFTEFTEIHGDRRFADDHAIVTGMALYHGAPVLVVGHQKGGGDTKQKIYRNFGYAKPEGYRKAHARDEAGREVRPADHRLRGHAGGLSRASSRRSAAWPRPSPSTCARWRCSPSRSSSSVCGEGGSGGALGIAIGDRVLIQEFAIYSVIPPEGCAAILWRDSARKVEAAEALKLTAPDMLRARHRGRDRARAGRRRPQQSRTPPRCCSTRAISDALSAVAGDDPGRACRAPLREVPQHGTPRHRLRRGVMAPLLWDRLACDDGTAGGAVGRARHQPHRPRACCACAASPRRGGATASCTRRSTSSTTRSALTGMAPAVDRILAAIARPGADRHPRRLRRGRHHVDGHPAPGDRVARRQRRALPPRAACATGTGCRCRPSSGCTPTACA